jgi:hypothetical protein
MKGTQEEVLKQIPDFDELMKVSTEITSLMYRKMLIESQIKDREATIFKIANTEEKYFQGGKAPSVAYIENTLKYRGLDGELLPMRTELASVTSELEGKKLQMDIYKTMIEVWRTLCSNQRTAGM